VSSFERVGSLLYNQPWAISDAWMAQITDIYERRVANIASELDLKALAAENEKRSKEGYSVTRGVACIDISGPLLPKASLLSSISGATSYSQIRSQINAAIDSKDVDSIVLNIDSPGGTVIGVQECADVIYRARSESAKSIVAMCNPVAASAAYFLASQADAVYATTGGHVGSIGVIAKLDNMDRKQRNEGNDPVIVRSSELKNVTAGGQMTPNQIQSVQAMVSKYFAMFKDSVVRGRPGINIDAVSTGEVWIGKEAQDRGLIDGITTLDDLVESLAMRR
jgi:signal peptide peptidase SppA